MASRSCKKASSPRNAFRLIRFSMRYDFSFFHQCRADFLHQNNSMDSESGEGLHMLPVSGIVRERLWLFGGADSRLFWSRIGGLYRHPPADRPDQPAFQNLIGKPVIGSARTLTRNRSLAGE